jgi:hypothetical protein
LNIEVDFFKGLSDRNSSALSCFSSINDFDRPGPSWVCAKCLVGWNVPVFRPKREKWEFGTVEAYIEETCEHSLCFMDDEKDWAVVESLPFKKYIDHCKLASLRNHPRGDLHMRLDSESGKMVNKSAPFQFEGTVKVLPNHRSKSTDAPFSTSDFFRLFVDFPSSVVSSSEHILSGHAREGQSKYRAVHLTFDAWHS